MSARYPCPSCGAAARLADDDAPGKKIRCRECGTVFRAEDPDEGDDRESRPARRRPPQSGSAGVIITVVAVAAGLLLLVGVGALAAIVYFLDDTGRSPQPHIVGARNGPPLIGGDPNQQRGQPPPLGGQPPPPPPGGQAAAGPEVGKPAPEIEGEDLDGKKFKLSDYKGKVVLLDFWGNW